MIIILLFLYLFVCNNTEVTYLADYTLNPLLGNGNKLIVLVKGFDQHLKNKRCHKTKFSKYPHVIGGRVSRLHTRGSVFSLDLSNDGPISIRNSNWKLFTTEPHDIDFYNDKMVISGGNEVTIYNIDGSVKKISNRWFKNCHTSKFSRNGSTILIAATGVDSLYEVNVETGDIVWEWSAWENGFDQSPLGHYLTRYKERKEELEKKGEVVILVDNPDNYNAFGLPTRDRACHLNGGVFTDETETKIITTLAHQGKGILIDKKTKKFEVVIDDLKTPHSFRVDENFGYIILNTGRGEVNFADENFKIVRTISMEKLPGVSEEREPLGEWTQYVRHVTGTLYSIIDIHRSSIHLFDPMKKEYRTLEYPDSWAVQTSIYLPPEFEPNLSKFQDLEPQTQKYSLVDREVVGEQKEKRLKAAKSMKKLVLTEMEYTDLEMIGIGAMSPLEGFMNENDYLSVLEYMKLSNGLVWSLPIIKSVSKEIKNTLEIGEEVALVDENENIVGIMKVEDVFFHDKWRHSFFAYGTGDEEHPGVNNILKMGEFLVGGKIELLQRKIHSDLLEYRLTPRETRKLIQERGWNSVVGFQTRNPLHRSHEYLLTESLKDYDGLLIHPLVGKTKVGDVPANVRMASYEIVAENYLSNRAVISAFPAWMRYAGPREAIFHGILRRNYGCTHFIVGRDHAGVGNYYGPFDAQKLFSEVEDYIGIKALPYGFVSYCKKCKKMVMHGGCEHSREDYLHISGTKVREMIGNGIYPPLEITRPEVASILIASEWVNKFELATEGKIGTVLGNILEDENSEELNWESDSFLIYNAAIKGDLIKSAKTVGGGSIYLFKYKKFIILDLFYKIDSRKRHIFVFGKGNRKNLIKFVEDEYRRVTSQQKGVCIWLTGLSGAGKTTLAKSVVKEFDAKNLIYEHLDGDYIRKIMNRDLGFDDESRNINIYRISKIAKQLTQNNIISITSFISPFRKTRDNIRIEIGEFVEVYISATLEVCEGRDVKGLYKLARAGKIPDFTGIDSPYEHPENPEIVVATHKQTLEESTYYLISELEELGYLKEED